MAFEDLVPNVGFLTDRRIESALEAGYLIEQGTWATASIRHASYMLRLGERVHLQEANSHHLTITNLGANNRVLSLAPGATAHLYSLENLRLPDSVLGLTVARGLLFAHPLLPENTYVDPGFRGTLYTVVTNITGQVVELTYEMPIARLFFYRLEEDVQHPYQSGAAVGLPQTLATHPVLTPATSIEASSTPLKQLLSAADQVPIAGNFIYGELFRRFQKRLEALTIALVIWPFILVLANNIAAFRDNVGPVLVNLIATLVASLLIGAVLRTLTWARGR